MAFVIGVGQTPVRQGGERTHAELAAEAVGAAIADAGLDPHDLDAVWFASPSLGRFGGTTGAPILHGAIPDGLPVIDVGFGGAAIHGGWMGITAGQHHLVIAVGVDRAPADPIAAADAEIAVPAEWEGPPSAHDRQRFGRRQARASGDPGWAPAADRPLAVDLGALEARYALRSGSVSRADLAAVVAKSRAAGAKNDRALLRTPIAADALLAEPRWVEPLGRSMVAVPADGAAAVIIASELGLARLRSRARAIRIASIAIGGGTFRALGERPGVSRVASRAFGLAGVTPGTVDLAELADPTAWSELRALDALGLGSLGEVATATRAGDTAPTGRRPINPSGGMLSGGDAGAASGIARFAEVVTQLRREAGPRQATNARRAVVHDGRGLTGFDDAVCAVAVLRAD
ncbi:MAG: thiolase family protein [Myxococcota bacterium]